MDSTAGYNTFAQTRAIPTPISPRGDPVILLPYIQNGPRPDMSDLGVYLPVDLIAEEEEVKLHMPADFPREPATPPSNATNPFVSLPGEILNHILSYLFDDPATYEIIWLQEDSYLTHRRYKEDRAGLDTHTHHAAETRVKKANGAERAFTFGQFDAWGPHFTKKWLVPDVSRVWTPPRRKKFRAAVRNNHPEDDAYLEYVSGPTAFLMTCRRFHAVGASFFYGYTAMSFGGMKLFAHFLNNMTPVTLPWLRKLYLYHELAGTPLWAEQSNLQKVEAARWDALCLTAATSLTGLKHLELYIRLNGYPPDLELTAPWARALCHFRDTNLDVFRLALRSGPWDTDNNTRDLRQAVFRVRRRVLGEAKWAEVVSDLRACLLANRAWKSEAEFQAEQEDLDAEEDKLDIEAPVEARPVIVPVVLFSERFRDRHRVYVWPTW